MMTQQKEINPNNLSIGDIVMVEEAWEDEAGHYHDEAARILAIDERGELSLDFFEARRNVKKFLKGCSGYMAVDFEKEEKGD